jgi:hypothetical protein
MGRCSIEVVAPVIGDRDRSDSRLHRSLSIDNAHDALEHDGSTPDFACPSDVVPRWQRCLHPLAVGAKDGRGRLSRFGQVRCGEIRHVTALGEVEQPPRPRHAFRCEPEHGLEVHAFGMDGLPQSRPMENDQSKVRINPFAPAWRARSIRRTMASLVPVQYIWKKSVDSPRRPLRWACRRRNSGRSRCPVRRLPPRRPLALRMHSLHPDRGKDHG